MTQIRHATAWRLTAARGAGRLAPMLAREIKATLREGFFLALMLLVFLSALERGLIGTPAEAGAATFLGPICHQFPGATVNQLPGAPASHDCCDECALGAATAPPLPLVLSQPAILTLAAYLGGPATSSPAVARLRTPRLSRAPPDA